MKDFTLNVPMSLNASPERIWRAWTDPGEVEAWYGLRDDWKTVVEEMDVRPGGRYRIALTPPGQDTFYESGEYIEVTPPERLVYSMEMTGADELRTVVTVSLTATASGSDLLVSETGYPSEQVRDRHQRGWLSFLERLHALTAGG